MSPVLLACIWSGVNCLYSFSLPGLGSARQSKIVAAIKDIKDTRPPRPQSEITADLIAACGSLIDRGPDGADAIIAGCTEIPLALGQEHLPVPYFDSLTILARAAIRFAGRTPIG